MCELNCFENNSRLLWNRKFIIKGIRPVMYFGNSVLSQCVGPVVLKCNSLILWNASVYDRVPCITACQIRGPVFRNLLVFFDEVLLALRPTTKLVDHNLSVLCGDCLTSILAASYHILCAATSDGAIHMKSDFSICFPTLCLNILKSWWRICVYPITPVET